MAKQDAKAVVGKKQLVCKVIACTCEHEYQNKLYGKNMRLHNPGLKAPVCTVCGKTKSY